ncbi:MerR family transcriptional regulator [Niallia sp. RD1]|uniref:MerR family transcriptional regulator n=1 Tax=Niallia sp. RD1 TaxID=2962858 RepID=UPI0020C1A49A|nr:MerR family transcriptional regulator [Niallia sp. RD1]UTI41254.1 MerR family transcriptional regulator [Niallia sp. RD1]
MKAYTIREASKKLTATPTKLKQWEKELQGIIVIPRTKTGARIYTEKEITLLHEVKNLYKEKRKTAEVKETLTMLINRPKDEEVQKPKKEADDEQTSFEVVNKKEIDSAQSIESTPSPTAEQNFRILLSSLENYKQDFLEEVKDEIRNGLKKEVLETITKEIKAGSEETIHHITNSVNKTQEKTSEHLEEFSELLHKNTEKTATGYEEIQSKIKKLSQISKAERKTYSKQWTSNVSSTKEIKSMIEHLSKSNEELNKTVEQLNENDQYLMETLRLEREQMNKEIEQRERNFQELVQTFRHTAASQEKRRQWWRIFS